MLDMSFTENLGRGSRYWQGDAPLVPESDFSDGFAEFVSLCLDKEPSRRPAANELLKHAPRI